ncbi:MAG TPA: hypothetical protein VE177_04215, partial [Candidatus Binatus sp.]|nr:hypothetical protein [Candidatus Binatus sp.]
LNRVLVMTRFHLRTLLDWKWLVTAWAVFGLQASVYGALLSRLVTLQDYVFYYALGLMVIAVFESASNLGRHFVEHAHEGELPYFLSLPISRRGLFTSNSLYGMTDTLLKVLPPLLVTLAYFGRLTIPNVVFVLLTLCLLGLGISGLMISMSFVAFKSVDIYNALIIALSALLIRFSTVFYPLAFIQQAGGGSSFANAPYISPLSYGADLMRWILGFDPSTLMNPVLALAVISAIMVATLSIGVMIVERMLEGIKAA